MYTVSKGNPFGMNIGCEIALDVHFPSTYFVCNNRNAEHIDRNASSEIVSVWIFPAKLN